MTLRSCPSRRLRQSQTAAESPDIKDARVMRGTRACRSMRASPSTLTVRLSEQDKDQDNHQDQAEAAGRVIAPAAAVRPSRERADDEQDQDDQDDETHSLPP